MINREIALVEQRSRIVNASKAFYSLKLKISDFVEVQFSIENKRGQDTDVEQLRNMMSGLFKQSTTSYNDFEVICDSVYNHVVADYQERDIEVRVNNLLSDISFTKIYNTTRPSTSIVI